jgi:hypothetical protein
LAAFLLNPSYNGEWKILHQLEAYMRRYNFIWIILLLTACASGEEKAVDVKPDGSKLIIRPSDLFAGDDLKFKDFMGAAAGSVEVEYEGARPEIYIIVEKWEKGKKTERMMRSGIFTEEQKDGSRTIQGELIYSVNPYVPYKSQTSMVDVASSFIDGDNRSKTSTTLNVGMILTGYGQLQLMEEIRLVDGQEAAIGGITASTGNSIQAGSLSEEYLKQSEYAVVYKLSLREDPDKI